MNKKKYLCFIHLSKTFCSFLTHRSSLCFGHFCATKPFTQTNCDEWIYNFCAFHSYLFYNDILSLSVTSTFYPCCCCCCFFLHSPVLYFSTRVVLEKRGKLLSLLCAFFLPPCTPFPLSSPSCSLSILPPSTLMRRRMTMNTPIIMRKQQAFPPPLHPFLPKHGAPISR